MNETEKMKNGLWFDANNDPEVLKQRYAVKDLCIQLNTTLYAQKEKREELLKKILPNTGKNLELLEPFFVDYGFNCFIKDNVFINHNAYFMDGASITIGSNCFIGPNCGLYTNEHPLLFEERNKGLERARPIVIEDNVWIGSNVTVLAGVTIGEGSVIGANSLVNKDIPSHVIAAGNPCRIIRKITKDDSIERGNDETDN